MKFLTVYLNFFFFQAGEHQINFSNYKVLFETEKAQHLKVVPKLTEARVQPSNLQKMNVRLATQVCSYSDIFSGNFDLHSR